MQNVDFRAECRKCKHEFDISQNVRHNVAYEDQYGRSILLTYYDCPSCGMRHFVQADNSASVGMLLAVRKDVARIACAKSKGRKIPVKMQDKYTKHNRHLDAYRTRLMRDWSGRTVTEVESGLTYTLEFSV